MTQVNKIGRGSISYTKSVIEPIMGALQGLIIVVNSEGGFASLKIQIKDFSDLISILTSIPHVSYVSRLLHGQNDLGRRLYGERGRRQH